MHIEFGISSILMIKLIASKTYYHCNYASVSLAKFTVFMSTSAKCILRLSAYIYGTPVAMHLSGIGYMYTPSIFVSVFICFLNPFNATTDPAQFRWEKKSLYIEASKFSY